MQLNKSIHATDIAGRESDRQKLAKLTKKFLKTGSVTFLETRTTPLPGRAVFNHGGAAMTDSPKTQGLAGDREEIIAEVRKLAVLEIEGVKIKRSAFEIGQIMRANGYKLRAQSVRRIAESSGVDLRV